MSSLAGASRLAVLVGAVMLFALPGMIGLTPEVRSDAPTIVGRQISLSVALPYEPPVPVLRLLESLSEGPSGDPILMAGRRDPRIDGLLTAPLVAAPDEWAMIPGEVAHSGPGTYQVAEGRVDAPEPDRWLRTVLIRVEDGLPVDVDAFADVVMSHLNDPRGWQDIDNVSWARTDQPSEANLTLTIATATSTDVLCAGVSTNSYTSCGRTHIVVINANRWMFAAEPFLNAGGTIDEYRSYVINHEVGHFLSHPHVSCPGAGRIAPVMLQQTLRLEGCTPNGWPNP